MLFIWQYVYSVFNSFSNSEEKKNRHRLGSKTDFCGTVFFWGKKAMTVLNKTNSYSTLLIILVVTECECFPRVM